jgi:hypothetical protein
MPTLSIRYVVYNNRNGQGRRRRRGPRFQEADNIFPPDSDPVPANESQDRIAPRSLPYGDKIVPFAFANARNTAQGNILFTDIGNGQLSIPIGENDVQLLIVYGPPARSGPDGGGGTEVYVDAFDVDAGDFSNDDFVGVVVPPDQTDANRTFLANEDGIVVTNEKLLVGAYPRLNGGNFVSWKPVGSDQTINGSVLSLEANQTGLYFAFYKRQVITFKNPGTPEHGTLPIRERIEGFVGGFVIDDRCGTKVPGTLRWPRLPNDGTGIPPLGPGPRSIGPFERFSVKVSSKDLSGLSTEARNQFDNLNNRFGEVAGQAFAGLAESHAILEEMDEMFRGKR